MLRKVRFRKVCLVSSFLFFIVFPCYSQLNNFLNNLSDAGKDLGNQLQQTFEKTTDSVKKNLDDTFLEKAGALLKTIQNFAEEYGPKAAEQFQLIINKYGETASVTISRVYRKYGKEAGAFVMSIYDRWGKEMAETVGEICEREGPQVLEQLKQFGIYAQSTMINLYEKYGKETFDYYKEMYGAYGTERGDEVSWIAHSVMKSVSDSAEQKKAVDAAARTAMIVNKLNGELEQRTRSMLHDTADTVTIGGGSGGMKSLTSYSKDWISKHAPYLKGTSIEKDSVGCIVYFFAYNDINVLTQELKVVKNRKGEYRSIKQAVEEAGPFDSRESLKALECTYAFETLSDINAEEKELLEACRILQKANAAAGVIQ